MKLRDVMGTFFKFPIINFDIWIHLYNTRNDMMADRRAESSRHYKGFVPFSDMDLACHQASINGEKGEIVFFCSENDEDW